MSPYDEADVIRSIASKVDKIVDDLTSLKIDVGALKVKSGVWGLMGGMIPAIGVALMYLVSKL